MFAKFKTIIASATREEKIEAAKIAAVFVIGFILVEAMFPTTPDPENPRRER